MSSTMSSSQSKSRARVITTQASRPAQTDEVSRIIQEQLLPKASAQPGFLSGMQLHDPNSGETLAITSWADQASLQRFADSADYREQLDQLQRSSGSKPQEKTFDVS